MTEAEWLAGADLDEMLRHLYGQVSLRKMRLFACACCRRVMHFWVGDPRLPGVIETAERHADGHATDAELAKANELALTIEYDARRPEPGQWITEAVETVTWPHPEVDFLADAAYSARQALSGAARDEEMAAQCALLREIVGNPFQAVHLQRDWLRWNRGTVREVARAIADERRFDELPILADALAEAGCDNEAILRHCREGGMHVPGCWVLDGLLARG